MITVESIDYYSNKPHLNDLNKVSSSLIEKNNEIPSFFIKLLDGRTMTVPFQPASEVGQYIKLIEQREGIPFIEQRLLFGGKQLKVEKLLSDYGLYPNSTMHLVSNLIGGMRIFIENLTDHVITLEVEPHESVESIRQKIKHLTGLYSYTKEDENGGNERALELTFNDMRLVDDHILSDYKIKENSTLYGNYSLRGWASCPTLTFQFSELVEEVFFSVDNIFGDIRPGLNLMGECSSLMCNYATIWVPKGFGTFNMNKEIKLLHHCSNCKKTAIKVINFGFYQCLFSIEGKYKDASFNPIEFQKEEQRAPDDRLLTYFSTNKREWYYLNVSTKCIQNKRNESNSGVPGMTNSLANSPWINDIPFLPESGGKAPFPEALSALESNNVFLTHQSDSEQKIAGSVILIGVLFTAAISYLLYSKYKS